MAMAKSSSIQSNTGKLMASYRISNNLKSKLFASSLFVVLKAPRGGQPMEWSARLWLAAQRSK